MFVQTFLTVALVAGAHCSPAGSSTEKRASPTVYLAGDSTMAKTSNGLDGKPFTLHNLSPRSNPHRMGPLPPQIHHHPCRE